MIMQESTPKQIIATPRQARDGQEQSLVVAIVGPTGSGKTAVVVKVAQEFNGVIISADSRQVYQGLDAGTNKEGTAGTWNKQGARFIGDIPQLLIDVVKIGDDFNVSRWVQLAEAAIELCFQAQKMPIIVGGTGLYVSALLSGYQFGGRNFRGQNKPRWPYLILELDRPRQELDTKSDQRLERTFPATIAEVEGLLVQGVEREWLSRFGLDYRAAVKVASGAAYAQELELLKKASRAYIRRQLTWWRHHEPTQKITNIDQAIALVRANLKTGQN